MFENYTKNNVLVIVLFYVIRTTSLLFYLF